MYFLRHTLDFIILGVKLFHRAADANDSRVVCPLITYQLFLLFLWIYAVFFLVFFNGDCFCLPLLKRGDDSNTPPLLNLCFFLRSHLTV